MLTAFVDTLGSELHGTRSKGIDNMLEASMNLVTHPNWLPISLVSWELRQLFRKMELQKDHVQRKELESVVSILIRIFQCRS